MSFQNLYSACFRRIGLLLIPSFIVLGNVSASAQTSEIATLLKNGEAVQFDGLHTGDQAIIENASGAFSFAGQELVTSSYSGVLGVSSQASYIMTINGRVEVGGEVAGPGEIIIILPYNQGISVEKFDAGRFVSAWPSDAAERHSKAYSDLQTIANSQESRIFWGLYETTAFNVSAPGSAEIEQARRSIVGGKSVQKIRFSGDMDPARIEQDVVDAYTMALINKDAQTIAELTDPNLFGGSDLRGNGNGARLLLASNIIKDQDWKANLAQSRFKRTENNNIWSLSNDRGNASIHLMLKGDFIYVSNINWQEK